MNLLGSLILKTLLYNASFILHQNTNFMELFLVMTFALCYWHDSQNFLESQGLQNYSKAGLEIIFTHLLLVEVFQRLC